MRKIVLWLPQGRIGNLLFQYQAVTSIFSNKDLIFTIDCGFLSIFKNKKNVTFFKLPSIFLPRVLSLCLITLRAFANWGIFSSCSPHLFPVFNKYQDESNLIKYKKGFFKNIVVFEGFFQNELYLKNLPSVKNDLIKYVQSKMPYIPSNKTKIAVHLRFRDYREISILGKKDVSLPASYYWNCIRKVKTIFDNCIFLIFTDDYDRANTLLSHLNNDAVFLNGGSEQFDFAAITQCDGAIISASTFSWWAARYIKNSNKVIVAPRYWMGFRSNIWFPKYIKSKSFLYVTVKSE